MIYSKLLSTNEVAELHEQELGLGQHLLSLALIMYLSTSVQKYLRAKHGSKSQER